MLTSTECLLIEIKSWVWCIFYHNAMTKHQLIMPRTLHSCFWFSQLTSEMSVIISLCSAVANASGLITRSFMSHFILLPRQKIRICFSQTQNLIFLVTFILHLPFTFYTERLCWWYHSSNPWKEVSQLLKIMNLFSLCPFTHSFPVCTQYARCYSTAKLSSEETSKVLLLWSFHFSAKINE